MKDFYYILGTEHNASSIEIREAYKKLSKKFHPDLNENDYYFESHFREISEAYNTLNDPYKRREYDASLKKSTPFSNEPKSQKRLPLPKSRHIDIVFSIILIFITSVFGYYVYHAIYGTKKPKEKMVATVIPVVKHHKRKHKTKVKYGTQSANIAKAETKPLKPVTDTSKTKSVQPSPVIAKNRTTKPPVLKPAIIPVTKAPSPAQNNITQIANIGQQQPSNLYTAYIRANATGVVYLRKFDNYNSDVVSNIPNNAKVTVLEQGKTFCKISFNNETGYVPKWTLLTK